VQGLLRHDNVSATLGLYAQSVNSSMVEAQESMLKAILRNGSNAVNYYNGPNQNWERMWKWRTPLTIKAENYKKRWHSIEWKRRTDALQVANDDDSDVSVGKVK
jgi:hypothetical protein